MYIPNICRENPEADKPDAMSLANTFRRLMREIASTVSRRRGGERFEPVTGFRFHWARPFSEGRAGVQMDGRWRFVRENGRLLPGDWFMDVGEFANGLAPVRSPATFQWGFLSAMGDPAVDCRFEAVGPFGPADPAPARLGNAWGYIDREGRFVVQPRFLEAGAFSDGFGLVRDAQGFNFVAASNRLLWSGRPPEHLEEARDMREGLAPVRIAGKWGYLDANGTLALEPAWEDAAPFSEGLAAVRNGGLWGAVDRRGRTVIAPQFTALGPFCEGLAQARLKTGWGYVDRDGQSAFPWVYGGVSPFCEGLAVVWGYCEHCSRNKEGTITSASIGVKYQYIDKTGQPLLSTDFNGAGPFRDGLARVSQYGQGVIDRRGKFVIDPRFDALCDVDQRHTLGLIDGKWAVLRCLT